jgi:hypothetical protein
MHRQIGARAAVNEKVGVGFEPIDAKMLQQRPVLRRDIFKTAGVIQW